MGVIRLLTEGIEAAVLSFPSRLVPKEREKSETSLNSFILWTYCLRQGLHNLSRSGKCWLCLVLISLPKGGVYWDKAAVVICLQKYNKLLQLQKSFCKIGRITLVWVYLSVSSKPPVHGKVSSMRSVQMLAQDMILGHGNISLVGSTVPVEKHWSTLRADFSAGLFSLCPGMQGYYYLFPKVPA